MLSFKKKPTPVTEILKAVDNIADNLMQLKKDKQYQPTKDDLKQLQRLLEKLEHARSVAGYVHRTMQQRFEGKPEGAAKWTNPEVLDYHYPE